MDISDYISTYPAGPARDAANALLRSAMKVAAEPGFERSVKLDPDGAYWNRFLLGIEAAETSRNAVLEFAREVGIPRTLEGSLMEHYRNPSSVLIGFEQHGTRLLYKVYLEFWNHVVMQVEGAGDRFAPILLNIGFKWDIRDRRTHTTTRYVCHPLLTPPTILRRLRALMTECPPEVVSALEAIVNKCSGRVAQPSFVYMEAEEPGQRLSFDLNLYQADLPLAEIADPMATLHAVLCPAHDGFEEAFNRSRFGTAGHLSGGTDRRGQPFVTLYFED